MTSRWVWFWVCGIFGLVLLVGGWLVPVHLRAVDASVIQKAGRGSSGLVDQGLALLRQKQLGAAQLLLQAAQEESVPGSEKLSAAITNVAMQHPGWLVWGGGEGHLEVLFNDPGSSHSGPEPFTEFVVRLENRGRIRGFFRDPRSPVFRELLACRALTNTVLFPPSQSTSGQAFDAAVSVCGLLLEEGQLTAALSNVVHSLAVQARNGEGSERLEEVLMDLMSLGQRFNWGQLVVFVRQIEDAGTLDLLANLARKADRHLPVLFSAIVLSGQPAAVARYVSNFSQTGLKDLGASLRFGAGGLNEILQRNQRL